MNRKWLIIILSVVLILLSPILFRRHTLQLMANGKTVAVAKRSILPAWNDGSVDVYVGKEKIFSLWEDFWDGPVFIYPFADGKRFLCDYDDDASMLDFVVDLSAPATNEVNSSNWPADDKDMGDYVRTYMASRITNVVFETKGVVRLPNYEELKEVSGYLNSTTPKRIKAGYFNYFYPKKIVLLDLATNRQSVWPEEK